MKLTDINQIKSRLETLLNRGFTDKQVEAFQLFISEITKHSHKFNLISKGDLSNILERHIADSLVLERYLRNKSKIVDIGSGAGFPGVPLAIILENTSFNLVEPREKRAFFLKTVKRALKLENISIYERRIEELPELTSQADALILRGVGGFGRIFRGIKANLKRDLEIFILTSQDRETEPIDGLALKKIQYNLNDSPWGGSILHYTVSRGT
ncbi:MAG: 16S rRNA (guanine(527)-N(7))-methyltransferase RsmG [Deltaproteobacteria bacterium RIFCSPHIGHO2_12_FULL_43_9]|nr:MAG: 16S rRNA (guanine(527)-N(7))-methyltransferase RsmG [Deltaproteobacteria bacterium RIFCSPHIGHO2_12_FULL_43_9]